MKPMKSNSWETKAYDWRVVPKKQLDDSDLPLSNEYQYRPYASIIYYLSHDVHGVKHLEDVDDDLLSQSVSELSKDIVLQHERDLLSYTLNLILDYKNGRFSNEFQGTTLTCGTCSNDCFYHEHTDSYICTKCDAKASASPNRIPRAIPVTAHMRQERVRLHRRLDPIVSSKRDLDKVYAHIAYKLESSMEEAHIGYVCTEDQVQKWDREIDCLLTQLNVTKEIQNDSHCK